MDIETRAFPPQTRLAVFEPATFDPATRTIEVVWTTGARVRRYDWYKDEYYDEELEVSAQAVDLSRLASGAAPVLDSHRMHGLDSQIGVVERAWIAGNEGRATLRFSAREDIAGIVEDIRTGIIRNISVGYAVRKYQITREEGQVPTYRAVEWQPHELSFVTVPADAAATTRAESPQGQPCEFIRATPAHINEEAPMSNARSAADAATAADPGVTVATPAAPAASNDAANDAATRAAEISDLAVRHGYSQHAGAWIRSGDTVEQVRARILDDMAQRDLAAGGHHNRTATVGADETDKMRAAAVEVLLARAGITDEDGEKRIRIAHDNPFRGHTLLDMARSCLARAGIRTDGLDKRELVGRAFTQGTSDFPVLLESAMHKTLQAAYVVAPDTWSRFCARGTVSDFRAHPRYRVGSLGNLDAKTELNEFKNKTIPDGEKASITAGTKGNIINLSREAIINDDLGAFIGLANHLGRAAKRTIEADVYTYLASNPTLPDGIALFHASHGNLGTSAAPTVDSFEEARKLMALQKDVGGNDYLDLRPANWLGSMTQGGDARVVNDAQYDPDTANKLQRPNKVRGLFRDVIDSPRISSGWYAFADPNEAPVIEVAFLDGSDAPYLEVEEGFSVDGSRWKVRLDFGIAAIDYRGGVKNAGG